MSASTDLYPEEDDPQLLSAVQEYLADLEAGRRPDRPAFMAKHPELARALGPYLDALDVVHAAAPMLQDHSGGRSAPIAAGAHLPAEPLGDFRIVREIGRGGMGVVYEAMQLSLGRRVALKVLPFAAALNARQLQRFKTEAHAAAQLHHTNIVPVYAVGSERGVHYYAMQLIEGRPLDVVIQEVQVQHERTQGKASTRDQRAGPTLGSVTGTRGGRGREAYRTAARIIAQVADALEYAHEAGVLHRDIKPANLLLDDRGNVWVTDFGLAQITADAGLTQTGDIFGTLRYMSPEQAAGRRMDVDHRTDIYSLGATLYEILTLEPVFPGQDRSRILNQILHDEPRSLRRIDRAIPEELETIVLKTLSKSPHDRYATAGELAADLRRFLDDRPILARRPSFVDQGRKWLRRHPATVWTAVLLLFFGVIALSVSTTLVLLAQKRTEAALKSEQQRAREADQRFQLARRSADEMIRIADEELSDNPMMDGLRKRLLESALAYYQEFIELRKDDPDAQQELEATRDRVKAILADLAVMQGAWQHVLLNDPAVQRDLKLSPEQREQLSSILFRNNERSREAFRDFPRRTPEEWSHRILDEVKEHEIAIKAILTPAQVKRWRQIALQVRGLRAFREADVVAALKLTSEQKEQIRILESNLMINFRPPGLQGPPGMQGSIRPQGPPNGPGPGPSPGPQGPPAFRQNADAEQKLALEKVLALLTPEQLTRWREMTGEPFSGMGRGPGPGPGRPFGNR